jgi:hypothetical protein
MFTFGEWLAFLFLFGVDLLTRFRVVLVDFRLLAAGDDCGEGEGEWSLSSE